MGGRKGRDGLFPGTACVKITGIFGEYIHIAFVCLCIVCVCVLYLLRLSFVIGFVLLHRRQ